EKVGIYIPGGSAPLFSTVLMLAIPAQLAGCEEIVLCSPPNSKGEIHPAILYTARLAGVDRIYKVGGSQAIFGMACGTESIPKADKIFGPGNQYVTAAKQLVMQEFGTAIDMPAGPSEVLVYADDAAVPAFAASDLLSQAEHGEDSQVILVANSEQVQNAVLAELNQQLEALPRKETVRKALENSRSIVLSKEKDAVEFINLYAPEHLILACSNDEKIASAIRNAGSVFLGNFTPESAGDYASGTNHTLPTYGHAKAYSGVSLESFQKKITFQKITENGLKNLGPAIEAMAEAEELIAHRNAVSIRLNFFQNDKN
ncbi:MAG: histidinol dehydrogenase, partial [Cytophagales bacterium]|nr:histidinol dehydrogenase [Cytophagales bacterium]